MLTKVITPHELLVADRANEVLLTGVCPPVPGQFVRSGEPLTAVGPLAWKRPFTCVRPEVSLQVGTLSVHFAAPRMLALVYFPQQSPTARLSPWPFPVRPILRRRLLFALLIHSFVVVLLHGVLFLLNFRKVSQDPGNHVERLVLPLFWIALDLLYDDLIGGGLPVADDIQGCRLAYVDASSVSEIALPMLGHLDEALGSIFDVVIHLGWGRWVGQGGVTLFRGRPLWSLQRLEHCFKRSFK